MTFAASHLFWLLLAPAALLAWEIFRTQRAAAKSHPKILQAEAGANSLRLSPFTLHSSARAAKPRVLLALGLACAVVALTRPQWGRIDEPVFDQSREILIAVDLSRSMLATDIKPSRLERTKLLIRSLLEKLDGERIGLVVFSGTAFLQSPLSADYEILNEFLPALGPDYLPEGGTNFHALLETSLAAFSAGTAADRFLIVLSDGEATGDDWQSLAAELKKKDIRVIALGVGTPAGSMIPDGAGSFVKDDRGAVVLSKLDDSTLRELAQTTNGTYRDASSWLDLAEVLQSTVAAGRKGEFMEKNTVRLVERFQWALAPALLFLLLSVWFEFPVRPRPRELKLSDTGNRIPDTAPTPAKVAALAAILLLSGIRFPVSAIAAATPPATPELSPLGKIVTRLADKPDRTGRDWAELARETVTWGQKIQSEQKPVPEIPVRDALAAVDLGSALDAKTADWPKLRQELEALLQKPDQQNQDKQEQPPPQKNDQDQNQQQDQQQNQDSKDQKSDQQKQQDQQQQQQQQSDQQNSDQQKSDQQKADDQKKDSAFGDMQDKKDPPPPQPGETQKVGGTPEKKDGDPKEAADPSLVMPLQKLDQLRNQDSPAKLFRLMEGEKKPTPGKKGKDW